MSELIVEEGRSSKFEEAAERCDAEDAAVARRFVRGVLASECAKPR
jgi:hypothetical protein